MYLTWLSWNSIYHLFSSISISFLVRAKFGELAPRLHKLKALNCTRNEVGFSTYQVTSPLLSTVLLAKNLVKARFKSQDLPNIYAALCSKSDPNFMEKTKKMKIIVLKLCFGRGRREWWQ